MISNTVKTDKQIKQIRYCFINLILVLQVGNRTGGTTPSKLKKKKCGKSHQDLKLFCEFPFRAKGATYRGYECM